MLLIETPIPAFDPRTDSQIRIELEKLDKGYNELNKEYNELNKKYNELNGNCNELGQRLKLLDRVIGQGLGIAKQIDPDKRPETFFERMTLLWAKCKAATTVSKIKQVLESGYKNLPAKIALNDEQRG